MAKWGEGDPRWIVEERPDATNVNNWHWTEKNASAWSRQKVESLLVGLIIDDPKVGRAEITKIERFEGDASANNRKGKLIFFYEWNVKLAWTGHLNGSDTKLEGFVRVPNLSDENDASDLDVSASVSKAEGSGRMFELVRKIGCELVRAKLDEYVVAFKNEFASGMLLPNKKETDTKTTNNNNSDNSGRGFNKSGTNLSSSGGNEDGLSKLHLNTGSGGRRNGNTSAPCAVETAIIDDRQQFKCTAEELYCALTTTAMLQAFTGREAQVTAEPGGSFQLLGGHVSGVFEQLEPGRRLQMSWRQSSWPANHHSHVDIQLTQSDDGTQLLMRQTNVPANFVDNTRQGWQRYYWDAMRRTFGFGVPLL